MLACIPVIGPVVALLIGIPLVIPLEPVRAAISVAAGLTPLGALMIAAIF